MLNEPASSLNDDHVQSGYPLPPSSFDAPENDAQYSEIRDAVETVLAVESEDFSISDNRQQFLEIFLISRRSKLLMSFTGQLLTDSEAAYAQLDELFAPLDLVPLFREREGRHVIFVVQGRMSPGTGGIWLSTILFILTVLSVLFVGTTMAIGDIESHNPEQAQQIFDNLLPNLWRGLPYAASILLILGAHELGHYFMARWHRTAASLPYFLPFPFGPFGTFGAAIRLREPMRNRKVLLDIGVAGPLAGLIFAIPILLIGLATSEVTTPLEMIPPNWEGAFYPYSSEGNSVVYALSKLVVFGRFLPQGNEDVFVNQLAWAGWTGLLVTGLNLIPLGQLDGGHVLYALLGKRARRFYLPLIVALLTLTLLLANELLIFVILILLMGNIHAIPLDDITPLDPRRRNVAIFALVIFVLVFVPQPLTPRVVEVVPQGGIYLSLGLTLVWQRLRR